MARRKTLRDSSLPRFRLKVRQVLKGRFPDASEEDIKTLVGAVEFDWQTNFNVYHAMWREFQQYLANNKITLIPGERGSARSVLFKCYKEAILGGNVDECVNYMVNNRVVLRPETINAIKNYLKSRVGAGGAGARAGAGAGAVGTLTA